jgi:hypothetical protein
LVWFLVWFVWQTTGCDQIADDDRSAVSVASSSTHGQGLVLHPSSEPLLRPELVSVFCDALELRLQHQGGDNPNLTIVLKEEAAAAEGESAKATTIDLSSAVKVIHDEPATAGSEKLVSEEVEQPSATVTKETKEEEEETEAKGQAEADAAAAASEEKKDGKRYVITINPNVLHAHANFTLTAPKEETEKDEALVKTLSAFLKDSILPRMVRCSLLSLNFYSSPLALRLVLTRVFFFFFFWAFPDRPRSLCTCSLRPSMAKRWRRSCTGTESICATSAASPTSARAARSSWYPRPAPSTDSHTRHTTRATGKRGELTRGGGSTHASAAPLRAGDDRARGQV